MDIKEFSRRLGVSITTVSHALNGKRPVSPATKQRIIEKMHEWGYVPNANARRLVSSKTYMVAFSSETTDTLADPYQLEVIRHICRLLRERGYDLLLDLYHDLQDGQYSSLRRRMKSRSVDGSIIIGSSLCEEDLETLAAPHCPCVYIDTKKLGAMKNAVSISVDSRPAYQEVFRCLQHAGHTELAILARHRDEPVYDLWMDELAKHGIALDPDWILFSEEDIEAARGEALKLLMRERRPNAIITRTEAQGQGALKAARQLNIAVPGELSIISNGDIFYSRGSEPPLATVSFDWKQLGAMSIEALFRMIDNPDSILEPVVITGIFYPRGSII